MVTQIRAYYKAFHTVANSNYIIVYTPTTGVRYVARTIVSYLWCLIRENIIVPPRGKCGWVSASKFQSRVLEVYRVLLHTWDNGNSSLLHWLYVLLESIGVLWISQTSTIDIFCELQLPWSIWYKLRHPGNSLTLPFHAIIPTLMSEPIFWCSRHVMHKICMTRSFVTCVTYGRRTFRSRDRLIMPGCRDLHTSQWVTRISNIIVN